MTDFAVIGAGPAGLTAAHRLASRGFDVVVLEREARVGGLTGSLEVAGQSVDQGSHRLHVSTPPEILELLAGLLGPELQTRRRNGRIRLAGRWLPFPLRPRATLAALGPGFLARAAFDAGVATFRRRSSATFADFVETGLGRAMGDAFYFPYVTKIWGLDPTEISGEQARRRISADTPMKLARRLLAPADDSRSRFYYPAGGFGRISEVLADAAGHQGVDIRLSEGAERIARRDVGWSVETSAGNRLDTRHVWSTIPLTTLSSIVVEAPRGPILEYRSMLLVYLAVARGRFSPFDAHYLPGADVPVTRVSEPKNYRDGPDPEGITVLCVEIPCSRGDGLWSADDGFLADLAVDSMSRSGMAVSDVLETQVHRIPAAYPVYRTGFESELGPVLDWVEAQPGLLSLGRQGLFAHDNTHHSMAMAWAAVDAVRDDGRLDSDRWSIARRSFDDHIVED